MGCAPETPRCPRALTPRNRLRPDHLRCILAPLVARRGAARKGHSNFSSSPMTSLRALRLSVAILGAIGGAVALPANDLQ